MNIAEKLIAIAENEQKVYDAGYSQAESDFWDGFQNFGNRTSYDMAFRYWGAEYIKPKYKITPTSQVSYLFSGNSNLKAIYAKDFDLGSIPKSTTWNASYYALCRGCTSLEIFEDINIQPNGTLGYAFYGCTNLNKIPILRVDETTVFNGTFHECPNLEEVWFDGVIASKGDNNNQLSFPISKKLKQGCIVDIFEHLKDFSQTGETAKIGINVTAASRLTNAEKAIATQKGWSIAIQS